MKAEGLEPARVADVLLSAVATRGGQLAVVADSGNATYEQLYERACAVAKGIIGHGIGVGERFVFQLPNDVSWLVAYWGVTLAGCVLVPVNVRNRPAELAEIAAKCRASAVLSPHAGVIGGMPLGERRFEALDELEADGGQLGDQSVEERLGAVGPRDIHLVQFTSGTTGTPKGAMLTHQGLIVNARALADAWELGGGEALLVPSPFSHVLGLVSGCLVSTLAGATVLTMESFSAERVMQLIAHYRPVGMTGTPTHYLMLIDHPDRDAYNLSSLRWAMYGGGPLSAEAGSRIVAELGIEALLSGFGMSETSGGVTTVARADPLDVQLGTVGRPLPTFEVRLVDQSSGADAGPGQPGELWARGSPVMAGYWDDLEETSRALTEDGWLRTGDLLKMGDDSCLRYVGRIKDMLIVGGYNVFPAEVERALARHPAVAESAVIGIPDSRLGEIPIAFVRAQPNKSTTSEELATFLHQTMADYKVPRAFEFMLHLPVTATGKVDKAKLRAEGARPS